MTSLRTTIGAIACIATAMIVTPFIVSAQRGENVTWMVDGTSREAVVYAPTKPSATDKVPLVFSFHGYGDTAENFQHTGLHRAWPEAVVVYVQALPRRGSGLPWWQVEKGQE